MNKNDVFALVAIIIYLIGMLCVGFFYTKRSNKGTEAYFIGGRGIGPWMTALSAEASDMSGWLLMGLPGVAYFTGASDAVWTGVGLIIGTYLNWLFVAKRLRLYSAKAGNAITLPEFFSNRFGDKRKVLMVLAALIILLFFCIYVGSCFVTCGKLFSALFGFDYHACMVIGALVVFVYTLVGGYLSVCTTDLIQGILMVSVIILVFIGSVAQAGGIEATVAFLQQIPGFLSLTEIAVPTLDAQGLQVIKDGMPIFDGSAPYGAISIVSMLAWGLGYFGMPQVLVRFMSIENPEDIKKSRRIAIIWVTIALSFAVCIGLIGRAVIPDAFLTGSESESVLVELSKMMFPAFLVGIVVSGIFAATMSSASSYMLIVSSCVAKDVFSVFKKDASDRQVLMVGRLALVVLLIFGMYISRDQASSIFGVVSYAWSGFGAAFGPLVLLSLYWRRATLPGALAGMLAGGIVVVVWNTLQSAFPDSALFSVYELLPAFLLALGVNVLVSLCTKPPSKEVLDVFDHYMDAD